MEETNTKQRFFLACRIIVVIIGFYHANKFFFPGESSSSRHLVFVGINVIMIFGLWKRPKWFIYFFATLMLQQFYSHGGAALKQWQTNHTVDWISVADVLLLPVIFIVLIKERKHASQAS